MQKIFLMSLAICGLMTLGVMVVQGQGDDKGDAVQGETLYLSSCASCHGSYTADGISGNIIGARLDNNDFIQASDDETLLAMIQAGRMPDDPANTSGIPMPPMELIVEEGDILHIIAYLQTLDNGTTADDTDFPTEVIEVPINPAYAPYEWELVVDNLDSPINVVSDGSERLFAVEQTGFILVIKDGAYLDEPFLDISRKVPRTVYSGGYSEQGLLGLAFHPNYAENGQAFVSYINTDGNSVIARYTVSEDDPNRLDPESEVILLTVEQPYEDHNGGNLAFGPDGYLYIGFGDGGRPALPNYFSQESDLFLGKMLRLDVDSGEPYGIPEDNPFIGVDEIPDEVWALGLRNPWRFSFDRETGDLFIGDVGQWFIEEINFQANGSEGGQNYGWSVYEGTNPYLEDEELNPLVPEVTFPIMEYTHDEGCSVTGGYVYRGDALPSLQNRYLFGDYCNGNIWIAGYHEPSESWRYELFMRTDYTISSFGEDANGELLMVDYKGAIYRLVE